MSFESRKWRFESVGKLPSLHEPIFIEGLPGIGNVGKLAVDFLIDELSATKCYDIASYAFPHSVFVNEDNLVELPLVEIFYKKRDGKKRDIILLGGDVQPIDEQSSYEFSDMILDLIEPLHVSEIITLGGIGLSEVPKKPMVFSTANNKKILRRYGSDAVNTKLYGVVGPIVGVSGLLLGLAARRNIEAITFLAETYGHPMYLGIKGAREILKVLNEKLQLSIDITKLDREIKDIESEIQKKNEQLSKVNRTIQMKKLQAKLGTDMDYIG